MRKDSLCIFFTGVGGQGILLATRIIGEAALMAGIPVIVSEVHGMAQRGGVVESAVVLGNRISPVLAEGESDILVSFEPLETLRAISKCNKESIVITNTAPIPPFTVNQGNFSYPFLDSMFSLVKSKISKFYAVDALDLALEAGSSQAVNVVIVGFLSGLLENESFDVWPSTEHIKKAMGKVVPEKLMEINEKAFRLGHNKAGTYIAIK